MKLHALRNIIYEIECFIIMAQALETAHAGLKLFKGVAGTVTFQYKLMCTAYV